MREAALLGLALLSTPAAADPRWDGYQVLMWQDQGPAGLAALHSLGVTGTKLLAPLTPAGEAAMTARQAVGLRWYTENLATDFYAAYHRWTPGRPVNWRFDAAKAQHRAGEPAAFDRSPSLSDPAWLATIARRLRDIASQQAPYHPIFHNLADESGIADLAAAWDFDLSAPSMAAMRLWLQGRYGSLQALNGAWGTQFNAWDAVRPALTDDAIRSDAAVPAWMDFKAWMDFAFAHAVRAGADAVHAGDPDALAGLEGAQVPGWGGYDYGLLAGAVDVMEIYDAGNAVEIAQSLNPALRVLTTSGGGGAEERHRLWHEWLLGGAGAVLWDEAHTFMGEDGHAGPSGTELGPLLRELGGPLGSQLRAATPEPGRVAILYSQPSFRLRWLLDRRAAGTPWTDRDAEAEFTGDNGWRTANRRAAGMLAGLGAPARWITPSSLDTLERDGIRVLVLPQSIALSDADVAAVERFAGGGGLVLADVPPGERDDLGRVRPAPPLASLAKSGALAFPAALRADGVGLDELWALLTRAEAAPPLRLLDSDGQSAGGLDIRLFRRGDILLVGIQGDQGERAVELRLPRPARVEALRHEFTPRRTDRISLQIGPVEPVLLTLSGQD